VPTSNQLKGYGSNRSPFFVVGATARDIILHYGFGLEIRRATQDIDVGVRLENWEEFGLISAKLIESGLFVQTREAQRVYFKETFPVDILPFGRISEPQETISWPQSEGVEMLPAFYLLLPKSISLTYWMQRPVCRIVTDL
jgi:predicted nucleotidyltransferase